MPYRKTRKTIKEALARMRPARMPPQDLAGLPLTPCATS